MNWRPSDWAPLADADPIPGDPARVRELARHLRDVAHTIEQQTEKLRTMCSSDYWDADAAKKFDHTAQDRAKELSKVYDRYHAASKALYDYVPTLEEEQSNSLTYRTQAQSLEDDRHAAQSRLDSDAAQPADTPERDDHATDAATVAAFHGHLQALRNKVAASAQHVHDAARTAAGHLDHTIHHDDLKDGWTDHVKQWIHEHADIISMVAKIAGWIATIAGVLALCVGWIPIIGQALAAVLTAIALTATLVSLVCHLALLWSGDGSLTDVIVDVIGLATFGVGRAVTGSLKAGIAGLKASGKMATAAEKLLPKIATKGGVVGDKVLSALTHGDLSKAAQLSGISRSTLRGMMGNEIGRLTQFGDGGVKAMIKVMGEGPGRFVPRGGDLLEAFHPMRYVDDLKGLGQIPNVIREVPNVASHIRAGVQDFHSLSLLAPDVAGELSHAGQLVHGLNNEVVSGATAALHGQIGFHLGQLTAFNTVDVLDKAHVFDRFPSLGSNGIGQWEVR